MDTHVKVLGVLEIALSAFGLLGALVLMLVFAGAMSIVGAHPDGDSALAIPIIGVTGMALVSFLLVLSIPGFIVGIGLLKRRPWARIAGIVLSIIGMTAIPVGTVLGIYGLWVLLSKETERLFQANAAA
jgi:hypothetical protein